MNNINYDIESAFAFNSVTEGIDDLLTSSEDMITTVKESLRDIVTGFDVKIQNQLLKNLNNSNYPILSEENNPSDSSDKTNLLWAVDPIDGTVNFANGLHYYGVSAGLCHLDNFSRYNFHVGAVYIPKLNEVFYTLGENKSFSKGKLLIKKDRTLNDSLISACFSGRESDRLLRSKQYDFFGKVNDSSRGVVRMGSASVQICFTAQDKLQATYGLGCKIWDVAGALAVAKNAGCTIFTKAIPDTNKLNFIVGSKTVSEELKRMLEEEEICQF